MKEKWQGTHSWNFGGLRTTSSPI